MTAELHRFQYHLEQNLFTLHADLASGRYRHGPYRMFEVHDNKRRLISVAPIRDRIVHRLLYEYLVSQYDHTFAYDVWSCRKGKGVHGAVDRVSHFLKKWPHAYIWKADIQKFFDSVDHEILLTLLKRKISDPVALRLLKTIISSYPRERERERVIIARGISIGNLTSQIFANIYLHEFDRLVQHFLKPDAYVRYGDDFILVAHDKARLTHMRVLAKQFLRDRLSLTVNQNDIIIMANHGIRFLGVTLWPSGNMLHRRTTARAYTLLNHQNAASYYGIIAGQRRPDKIRSFQWHILTRFPPSSR